MGNRDTGLTPVTVLGLGLMGQALAGAFLRDGYPTTVWNRTAAKADGLVAEGAKLAGSVRDAVAGGRLVVICVSDYEAVRELLDPLEDVLDGRVLVNLTSGTSAQAREIGEWAARRGGGYLDGAIMAVPAGIGTADATIVYSGPRTDFDLHEPVLRSLAAGTDRATGTDGTAGAEAAGVGAAGTVYLGGDHGLSSLFEVAVLSLMWNILNGFLHGAALLETAGIKATAFASLAEQAIGTVAGWLPGYAQQIDDGAYPALDSTIDTHLGAMEHLVQESVSLGVNAEFPKLIKALTDRAVAGGRGGDGYAALIEQFRKPSEARP
ncbi:NAD(P)-dependent oxidoreductase [Actinomadura soli]|uniref:NAD(P)-dependent oxidoreductase n=2 Tax=Actinomadura soli TaxID=2508997 RepID=A0A5C4J117_9ACTN|nr:NAD(P)-dependent oxidoreductase [Actinomadura soli]